jgi:purine-nucleoside phosphorylase
MTYYDQVKEAADAIRGRVADVPEIGVVLGSGLGDFAYSLADAVTMPYSELPHWPASRVIGHDGTLVIGNVRGRPIAALAGRCHAYEGHGMPTVTFAVRALALLGVKTLILTNAAGGVNTGFSQGALMVIDDHINLMAANPLVGANDERFGDRFPDMTEVYSSRLRAVADRAGKAINLLLPHGIYVALLGPSYETPAEIRYLRTIGADAVGMSTVPEVILARHCGLRVAGVSAITNLAEGMGGEELSHEQTLRNAEVAARDLVRLVRKFAQEF